MNDIEYRIASLAVPEETSDNMLVEGYAAVFGSPTVVFVDENKTEYKEVMDYGCIDDATIMDDVVFRYNHNDSDLSLARTANNTLSLSIDNIGLHMVADIAPTTQGRDIYTLIQRKDITQMSIGMQVDDEYYDYDTHTRHIKHIYRIVDVSCCELPAYKNTSIDIVKRSFKDAEDEIKRKLEQEKRYKMLYIKTLL